VKLIERDSDYSLDETLAGRRVIFESITPIKNILTKRFKQNKACGFHIGSKIQDNGYNMLFSKQFDVRLRRKIDKK
jgi:hypothetical protein